MKPIMTKVNLNVPALRFKDFDGEWSIREIGEFVKERSVSATKNAPLYSLTIEHGVVPKSKRYERSFLVKSKKDAYKLMHPNDFAFNPMNLRFGALAKYKGELNVSVSKYYNIFYCIDGCDPDYLEYFLTSYKMIQYYNKMSSGTLEEKKRVHYLDFVHFKKRFPSLPEQKKIATFLSTIDQKIQELRRKKELLETYKKGLMQQLFSGELRFKDAEGKDFPDWEEKRLGEVCIVNPKNSQLPTSFIYIDLESVSKGRLIKENKIELNEAPSRAQRKLLVDDIIYQTVRPYQKNNLLFNKKGNYVASTGYAQLRIKDNAMFIYQLLHTSNFVNKVLIRCTGTSYPAINSSELAKIFISIPCLAEQKKIAHYLSGIDKKIENIVTQITQTQTFKKGLLQQLFV